MRLVLSAISAVLGCVLACSSGYAHQHSDLKPAQATLGTVLFETSCLPQVQADFNRAVALLHSFWLNEAERTFMEVSIVDPDCAMAHWGVAMAEFNELNGGPTPEGVIRANQALARADAAREKDPREEAYIRALHRFFDGYTEADSDAHASKYTDAMEEVATRYPNDMEGRIFYALALISSDPPDDVALTNPQEGRGNSLSPFQAAPQPPRYRALHHSCQR